MVYLHSNYHRDETAFQLITKNQVEAHLKVIDMFQWSKEMAKDDPHHEDKSSSKAFHERKGVVVGKKKRGGGTTGQSIEEEVCLICGDRASGYHYNALSCEGCKGFFRRSITRGAHYHCKSGGNCEMDMWMRRRCQFCRLKRCKEVGMKEECLLSDEQCKARDVRRKARQHPVVSSQTQMDHCHQSPDSMSADSCMTPDSMTQDSMTVDSTMSPPTVDSTMSPPEEISQDTDRTSLGDKISPESRALIERLVYFQDKYELPTDEDVKNTTKITFSTVTKPKELSDTIYKQMAEMTVLVTQLVVEFAKRLPGFMSLHKEDQIVLLKGSACEVMCLRSARRYDYETDTIVFANGMPYTRDNMRHAGLGNWVDAKFDFCRGMGKMVVDNAEYAILSAICILSERPGLLDPKQVERLQEPFIFALEEYTKVKRMEQKNFFAKVLMKLTELRTLSVEHADVLLSIKVEKGNLPPLLNEYFDVKEDCH